MLRAAGTHDVDFIYDFVISEARKGHFSDARPRLLKNFFFKRGLKKTIAGNVFRDITGKELPAGFFIYEENGQRAGFFSLIYRDDQITEIWLMGIIREGRGRGLGSQLLCLAENKARELYHPATMYFVRSYLRSESMISILEKNGYEKEKSGSLLSGVWTK